MSATLELARQLVDGLNGIYQGQQFRVVTPTGVVYTLEVYIDNDVDMFTSYDIYGKIEWAAFKSHRPHGFDGKARIVHRDRDSVLWWQPPVDLDAENIAKLATRVRDYVTGAWYYVGFGVTVSVPCCHCGGGVEREANLWGIETDSSPEYFAEVVWKLMSEALEATKKTPEVIPS